MRSAHALLAELARLAELALIGERARLAERVRPAERQHYSVELLKKGRGLSTTALRITEHVKLRFTKVSHSFSIVKLERNKKKSLRAS